MKAWAEDPVFRLLQWSAFGVFLGRAWQHLVWDAPYRALFWDERLFGGLVAALWGMEWGEWASSSAVDAGIQRFIQGLGVLYLLCALAALGLRWAPRLCRPLLFLGGLSLGALALMYTKERFYVPAQFIEYTLQFGSPFLLLAWAARRLPERRLLWWMKVAAALTFTGHGLYALNVFPTPVHFHEMTISILGVGEAGAAWFLRVVGALDLTLSALLFFPRPWPLYAAAYAAFWGFCTAAARICAHLNPGYWDVALLEWWHESVMRVPHFLVPLAVVLMLIAGSMGCAHR
jgi:hypothetical protein